MMGRLKGDQSQLFYEFHLDDVVPADHLVRQIERFWICRGCTPSLRLTIPRSVDRRSIRCS